jgi:enoyl-CoA hydratase
MSDTPVVRRSEHGLCRITVQRPDKLNALDTDTLQALHAAFDTAAADPAVRVVVLTGAGEKAFVAGADIAAMATLDAAGGLAFSRLGQRLMQRIEAMDKPVIARINGYALGGGLELALACHLRIAAARARLGLPEIGLGLLPGFGGSQRVTRLAGRAAALELCLGGEPIPAARAETLGLVHRVVADDALDAEVDALAARLAAAAPLAVAAILDAVRIGADLPLDAALEYESARFGLLFASADMREGVQAFLERRKPSFEGR